LFYLIAKLYNPKEITQENEIARTQTKMQ